MVVLKTFSTAIAGLVSFATQVASHGLIEGYTVNDIFIWNYWPGGGWRNDQKITPGWTTDTLDFGYVRPSTYSNGDIICHRKATPGALSVKLKAGDIMHFQWTNWVPTHHGPMMHYMASTEGVEHQKVDKFKLKWNKIDEYGLIDPLHSWNTSANQPAGYWAADKLIIDGGRWDFQIPKKIAKGKYIVRAETVAVHSSMIKDGAQHYPQCINIEITEGGTDTLSGGVVGTELYKPSDSGIGNFDIFKTNPIMTEYPIPGPKVHECGQAKWDQTPHPGSAPIWYGPGSAEEFGFKDGKTVGRIGVDPPNGGYYGNGDFTTDSLTTASTPNKINSAVDPPPAATTTSTASNAEPTSEPPRPSVTKLPAPNPFILPTIKNGVSNPSQIEATSSKLKRRLGIKKSRRQIAIQADVDII